MNAPKNISPHFNYHEFISKGIWEENDEAFLRKLIDPRLIVIMEKIRVDLDERVHMNNWFWGGPTMYRGFRPKTCPVGALYSQHKFGRAADFKVDNMTANEVRQYILSKEQSFFDLGLTRLEDGRDAPTWVHLDLAWTGDTAIKVFRA